jgi:hypothetical protein
MPSTERGNQRDHQRLAWRTRRERLWLECRECEVICERVVSPWQCLKAKCPYVYSYQDEETTCFGCLHKVFVPELDLAAFSDDQAPGGRGKDPYGPIRVSRLPRPECRVTIEQAYETHAGGESCCNPTFFHEPVSLSGDRIRLVARPPDAPDEDRGPRG